MSVNPYIGEISIVAFNFAPRSWSLCNGQLVPIQQNTALFSILGTTYGGNGTTTFALPNFQGRCPIHTGIGSSGTNYLLGESAGTVEHTLNLSEMPVHNHPVSNVGVVKAKTGNQLNSTSPVNSYFMENSDTKRFTAVADVIMGEIVSTAQAPSISTLPEGNATSHSNLQPYLVLNFIISLEGEFPARN